MDTTIEVTPAANPAPQAQTRRADSTVGGQALREAVVRVIEEELAELMRIRGS
jgi:hypothetical protein